MYGQNYDPRTGKFLTNRKYQEILKLDRMLTEANIPHTLDKMFDGWQICYPTNQKAGRYVMDAIEHYGSYGNDADLLEIMGLLTPEEEEHDSVLGHLTAEEVFERIKKHHDTDALIEKVYNDVVNDTPQLPHTRTDPELNAHISEIIADFRKLVEKAKSYGLDIKLIPNSIESLELYFHDDYPGTILVDKEELGI